MDSAESPQGYEPVGPSRVWLTRRRAVYAFAAFLVLSFVVHFTLGPAITKIAPSWQYPGMPEQAVTIISVSKLQQNRMAPRPMPTPTPIAIKRTHMNLALVQLREMVNSGQVGHNKNRPATKTEQIELKHYVKLQPRTNPAAPLAVVQPRITPPGRRLNVSAAADTGGSSDRLGATQWGDDNPPQVLAFSSPDDTSVPAHQARVKVDVGPDGGIIAVTLLQSSGDPAYDAAALAAARRCSFAPATLNGLPVHGSVEVDFPAAAGST